MSKILDPLKMVHPAPIHLSLLPPRQQLDLHVNAATFLAATAGQKKTSTAKPPGWNNSTRDRVAAAIHETWRRLGIKRGWLNSELDCDFADLPLFYQNSNRAAAERMLHTLDLVNLTLTNGRANADEKEDTRWRIEYNLELLAEAEHDGWMNWYIDQGWRWWMKKDIEAKTHPCLKPYNKLSPEERNKDWDSLRHYHEYADVAKMKIVIQRKDC